MFDFAVKLRKNAQAMNWEDLRYLLAVGRHRTLSAAGRNLGVNHSTILRRIRRIEEDFGTPLFEKQNDGYVPTTAGEEAIKLAERVEIDTEALTALISGHEQAPSGTLRVTTTYGLMFSLVTPAVKRFRDTYTNMVVELVASDGFVNLSKRHADVAIRPTSSPLKELFGRKISDLAFAVYGSRDYLSAAPDGGDLRKHRWILPDDDSISYSASEKWLRKKIPNPEIAVRLNSVLGMYHFAKIGMGLAVLPCHVGDSCPDLRRVGPMIEDLKSELWILTHPDIRHLPRVTTFLSFMGKELVSSKALMEGIGSVQQPSAD